MLETGIGDKPAEGPGETSRGRGCLSRWRDVSISLPDSRTRGEGLRDRGSGMSSPVFPINKHV